MKSCPICNRTYADDTLSFCLEDGARLSQASTAVGPSDPGATLRGESETTLEHRSDSTPTEILNLQTAPAVASTVPTPTAPPQPRPTMYDVGDAVRAPKQRNTAFIIGCTVVATILLISLGGVGAWVLFRDAKSNTTNTARANVDQNKSQTPDSNNLPSGNSRVASNAGAASDTNVNNRVVPTPSPLPSVDAAAVREQVTSTLNGWAASTRARDINAQMSYYADTLDTYYNSKNVGVSRVRADRERAYAIFDTLDVQLSNIKVTPGPTGEQATATFDKKWTFTGEKYSSGSVQQRMWLAKIGGRWRITGEKELQVYYVNR